MPRRTDEYRGLTHASRIRLLAEVHREPGLMLRDLAERTGLHENTVRDHLAVLEREGLITRSTSHRGTRGRPPATYHPVADPTANPAAQERIVRAKERGDLLRRVMPGSADGDLDEDAQYQLDALYEHLDDSGLQPEIDGETLAVDVVPCPYYPLEKENLPLVCDVHAELIRNVLRQVPGPVRFGHLEPFVTPALCRVYLQKSSAESANSAESD